MADMVCDELLCFVRKHFGSVPHLQMNRLLCGFYSEVEVSAAKILMISESRKILMSDNMPKIHGRKGEFKQKNEIEDILELFTWLDKKKKVFPRFVGEYLDRIPPVKPDDVDLVNLATSVSDMKSTLEAVTKQIKELTGKSKLPESKVYSDVAASTYMMSGMANSQNTSILPGYANKVSTRNSNSLASAADTETRVKHIDGEPLLGVQCTSKVNCEVNKVVTSGSTGSSSAIDTETRVKYVDDEPLLGVHRSAGCIRASPPDTHVGYVDPAASGNAHI